MLSLSRPSLPTPRRAVTIVVFFACVGFLGLLVTFGHGGARLPGGLPFGLDSAIPARFRLEKPCTSDLEYLKRPQYNLTKTLIYQKRCIRAVRDDGISREVVAEMEEPLIGDWRTLDLSNQCRDVIANGALGLRGRSVLVNSQKAGPTDPSCKPITLKVPKQYPERDYSDMIFGVATTFDRLQNSMPQLEHWLANTGAQLVAILVDFEEVGSRKVGRLADVFKKHDVKINIAKPWDASWGVNEQHFTLLRDLLWQATAHTKWAVIIDDDTFFPSLHPVLEAINVNGTDIPAYLGGLSENRYAVDFHGHMAFGGAGVFLSMPLLKKIEPQIEDCLDIIPNHEGDGLLGLCIANKTDTPFTAVNGLHQFDMGGDLSGYFESGNLPLSVHHWKTWFEMPVDKVAMASAFCGGCLLQRWRFGADTVLSNGYSIVTYPDGTKDLDLSRMEATWGEANDSWEWSMGPMRNKLDVAKKKSYILIDSEKVGDSLRQIYLHRPIDAPEAESDTQEPAADEVIELWWDFSDA